MPLFATNLLFNSVIALIYWGIAHFVWDWFRGFGMLPAPIWPAAAVALAVSLRYGSRVALGIYLGSVLANWQSLSAPLPIALGIGVMNTIGPVFAAAMIRRLSGELPPLRRLRDVSIFLALGVVVHAALTATGGIVSLWIAGEIPGALVASSWSRWWVAHAGAVVLFAPLLLVWSSPLRDAPVCRRMESVIVLLVAVGATGLLFFGTDGSRHSQIGLPFLLIIPLAWSAVRLPERQTLTLLPVVMLVAMAGTVAHRGPFFLQGNEFPMLSLGLMGLAFSVTTLLLMALATERRRESERYRLVVENSNDLLAMLDTEGRLIYASPHYCTTFGISEQEAIGREIRPLVHPDHVATVLSVMERLREPPHHCKHEVQNLTKDGWRWIAWSDRGILDENGQVKAIVAVGRDVTARRIAEQALAASEALERRRAGELEAILAAVPAFVFIAIDPECRQITGSQASYRLLGVPFGTNLSLSARRGQIQNALEFRTHGQPVPMDDLPVQRAARGESIVDEELEIHFPDGRIAYLAGNAVPLRKPDGMLNGAVAAFVDITQRKQAEASVREAEERLRLAASAAGLGVLEWDADSDRAIWENERMYEIFGRTEAEGPLSKAELLRVIHPDDVEPFESALAEGKTSGEMFRITYRIRRSDGEQRWVEVLHRFERVRQGKSLRLLGIMADITDRRQAELALARKNAELERINAELEEFAYIASHDLKAPLRAVANLAYCIHEDAGTTLDSLTRERLQLLRSRITRMDNLINALLAYARIGRVVSQERQHVALEPLLTRLANELAVPEGFQVHIESPLPTLSADPIHLEQIFQNLVANAVQHHDNKEGTIWIRSHDRGELWQLEVADDGPGIPPIFRQDIFKMFRKLRAGDDSAGIGLAVVRKLVQNYSGKLEVTDNQPRGTSFLISWPKEPLLAAMDLIATKTGCEEAVIPEFQ